MNRLRAIVPLQRHEQVTLEACLPASRLRIADCPLEQKPPSEEAKRKRPDEKHLETAATLGRTGLMGAPPPNPPRSPPRGRGGNLLRAALGRCRGKPRRLTTEPNTKNLTKPKN